MVESSIIVKWSINRMASEYWTKFSLGFKWRSEDDCYSNHHLVNKLPTGQLPTEIKSVNQLDPLTKCSIFTIQLFTVFVNKLHFCLRIGYPRNFGYLSYSTVNILLFKLQLIKCVEFLLCEFIDLLQIEYQQKIECLPLSNIWVFVLWY